MWSKINRVCLLSVMVSLFWIKPGVHCWLPSNGSPQQISLVNNGYTGILIGIEENVAENPDLIEKIKEVFIAGSGDLYTATRNRAYFKEITILVPKSWSDSPTYDPLTYERYDKCKIKIAEGEDNEPYVSGIQECGVGGEYMHLTPQYIMDPSVQCLYGTAGRLIVHEWGHLRYGVYDEYPKGRDPIYYRSSTGSVEATGCSLDIKGTWSPQCQVQNGIPTKGEEDGCYFDESVQIGGYSASIMYKQFLPYMMHFCDSEDNVDLSGMVHNYEAPTQQNVQCNYKSVWEVLNDHVDFKDGANPPRTVTSTVPTFKVVKRQPRRTVFVLDISGSMAYFGRIDRLRQAIVNYINNVVQDGEYFSMVVFNNEAYIKSQLVEINDSQRASMLLLVPSPEDVGWQTSIGAGILKGIDVLEHNGQNSAGGILLVISDGEENRSPSIADVRPTVGHVIHIFIKIWSIYSAFRRVMPSALRQGSRQ
ncbi:calcium-activated chloride channel regulator 4A-like [Ptychodera flava]|uniref:calcium-activated chloride channel regulator 4A-like n=1 Tax=Ptychodera flava TaxID=63121 RepID=UPI00396A433D